MVSEPVTGRCKTLVGVGLDPLYSRRVLKTVRLTMIRNELKWTISISGRLGLLQMVSEPDIGRCVNEDVGLPREGGL